MVIETTEEFHEFLLKYNENDTIILPVLCGNRRHFLNDTLSFLFVFIIDTEEYFVLPYKHNDCISLPEFTLSELNNDRRKYTLDKDLLLGHFNNTVDINLLQYITTFESIEEKYSRPFDREVFSNVILQSRSNLSNTNRILPIYKQIEKLVEISKELKSIISEYSSNEQEQCYSLLNRKIESFHKIETVGLNVDPVLCVEHFPSYGMHIKDSKIYSKYNIFTKTGRPSNKFGNLNFAALNRENGERSMFTSRFGDEGNILVFDYESYHLRLIANLVDFEFPNHISVHEYLGRFYFGKEELTEEEYSESKKVSFEIMYGGISDSIADAIPFFKKMRTLTDSLWNEFNTNGYIETYIFKQKMYKDKFEDMNASKLINYYTQNYETERNVLILEQIQEYLQKSENRIFLYLYDAFILDVKKEDSRKTILDVKLIMEQNGKFPISLKYGKNFHELVKVKFD